MAIGKNYIPKMKKQRYMMVIFGATGDLTKTKLIPALYWLFHDKVIRNDNPIVCIGRKDFRIDEFFTSLELEKNIPKADKAKLGEFLKLIRYYAIDFEKSEQKELRLFLNNIKKEFRCQNNKIFYLAMPPGLFKNSVEIIKASALLEKKAWNRIVFEKPFGNDLNSARKLNEYITSTFEEKQIYRIDHYLGKELIKNIMVFRFANSIFEEVLNNKFVDHVQITLAENKGIENRSEYYDKSGAIRDMMQNHMMQILSLLTMEEPKSLEADEVRNKKVSALKSIRPLKKEEIVIGQYSSGMHGKNELLAYTDEHGIPKNSKTETYAAMKVHIDNPRWKGVPFYLRTGKRMAMFTSEINIVLKDVSCQLFCHDDPETYRGPNIITIRIQPDQGIAIRFNAKFPGHGFELHPVAMDFCHHCVFGLNTPQAYEIMFYEIIKGDQTMFSRWDEIEQNWKFIEPAIKMADRTRENIPLYRAGEFGPKESDTLLAKDKRKWFVSRDLTG